MLKELESTRLPSTKTDLPCVHWGNVKKRAKPVPHLIVVGHNYVSELVPLIPISPEHSRPEVRRYVEPRQLHRTSPFR